ncbi:MAG: hypothetical protein JO072_08560 [Parafilimonas sp.]|nr:hypothetical protein [Parafilimonas sp.]
MKKTNVSKLFIAAIALCSAAFLNSCSKDMQHNSSAQASSVDNGTEANKPIAWFKFDSSWTETEQNLAGAPHNKAKFSSMAQAHAGKAAFLSKDSGYVSYNSAGTAIPNITTGLTVDVWVYATTPKADETARTVFCVPQTGAFWGDMHILLDNYHTSQGDSQQVNCLFKSNKPITYTDRFFGALIPNFYNKWSHIQFSYDGSTSELTFKVNGKAFIDHVVQYTDGTNTTKLGNLEPNPSPYGVVIGAFQNQWKPALFGDPQPWMHHFKGRVDELKIYNKALF